MVVKQSLGLLVVSLCRRKHTMSRVFRPVMTTPTNNTTPTKKGKGETGQEPHAQQASLSKSVRLMTGAGLIRPSSCSGSFHLLPMALKSLEKLVHLVDKWMEEAHCQKIQMPLLTSTNLWATTGRLEECAPELMTVSDRHSKRFLLSPTHEEAICDLLNASPTSYRQLPLRLYQITDKFRDEKRPRFGLLRARQFLMKDLYTFDTTEEAAAQTYDEIVQVYEQLFNALGLKWVRATGSTGTIGGKRSDEFHLVSEIGEDNLITCSGCGHVCNGELMINDDVAVAAARGGGSHSSNSQTSSSSPPLSCLKCGSLDLSSSKSIEVGHAFLLGTKYTKPLNTTYSNATNSSTLMEMGCYGIGVSRLLAAVVEILSTDKEIRWPPSIAPYFLSVIPPKGGSKEEKYGDSMFQGFNKVVQELLGNDVIVDDRLDKTVGFRLSDAKKLGIPYVAVFGKSILPAGPSFPPLIEMQDVNNDIIHKLSYKDAIQFVYDAKAKIVN